jgi:hypothetical protein
LAAALGGRGSVGLSYKQLALRVSLAAFESLVLANCNHSHSQLQQTFIQLQQIPMDTSENLLTHEEIWDDSTLVNAWDEALNEYKVGWYLSVFFFFYADLDLDLDLDLHFRAELQI